MTLLAGLDIGTSGCKCTVMTSEGEMLSSCYSEYTVSRTAGIHEANAAVIWQTAQKVIGGAVKEANTKHKGSVNALSVTSFGESVVLLDEKDEPLFPIMLYTDPRGQRECAGLCELLGEKHIYELCGHRPNVMYSLPKLIYLKETNSEVFVKTRRILPIASYLIYKLCGEAVSDYSLLSRTMMLNVKRLDYADELLDIAGISRDILPKAVPMGTIAGVLRAELTRDLGLRRGTKIVVGCQDQIAAVLGAGALKSGLAVLGSGTVECITPVFDGIPPDINTMFENGYAIVPAINGLYVTYAFIFTGGALLQWFRDRFAADVRAQAENTGQSAYTILDSRMSPEPGELLVLPHFAGAATPYMDNGSRGAIIGLTLEHDEMDIYKALLEGVALESRVNMERLAQSGVHIDMLRATGGGAKSKVWLQIKADVLNRPLETLASAEAGTVGSIMLAGLADGVYPSINEAMSLAAIKEQITPRVSRVQQYNKIFARYSRVYDAVKSIYYSGSK